MASGDEERWRESFRESVQELDERFCVTEGGRIRCCIGLRATFYFAGGGQPEVREKLLRVLERYQQEAGGHLRWGADPVTSKPKKLAGTAIADPGTWREGLAAPEWNMVFHGAEKRDDASPWSFVCVARERRDYPSWLTFTLPLSWLADKGRDGLAPLVLDCCRLSSPLHGYAGFSLIQHVNEAGESPAMRIMQGLAFRFLGLEVDFPEFLARHLAERIKGINWLTILGEARLADLGGRERLREELGEGFALHDYPGGVVVQAGPHPIFGDVNRREDVGLYRTAARVLAPIRVDYRHSMASMSGGAFSPEKTEQWFHRFDGE